VPNKIFVGGVPITCTEEQFKSYFEVYGAISKVELHALRGFGYITYESVDAVDSCLENYKEHYLCRKWVEVKRSIPRELIDAYEREQKRLAAELAVNDPTAGGEGPAHHAASPQHRPLPSPTHHTVSPTSSMSPMHAKGSAPTPTSKAGGATPASAKGSGRGSGLPAATPTSSGRGWGVPPKAAGSAPAAAAAPTPAAPTQMQAAVSDKTRNSHITQLKEMGFSERVAKKVLSECVWDVNKAIDRLLAGEGVDEDEDLMGTNSQSSDTFQSSQPKEQESVQRPSSSAELAQDAAAATPAAAAPAPAAADAPAAATDAPSQVEVPSAPAAVESGKAVVAETPSPPAETSVTVAEGMPATGTKDATSNSSTPAKDLSARETLAVAPEETPELLSQDGMSPEDTFNNALTGGAPTTSVQVAKKRLERVSGEWKAEDASQLTVQENDFVLVWTDTESDNGWIHAEMTDPATGNAKLGWMPACHLKKLPDGHSWMRVKQSWSSMDESQCTLVEGGIIEVWVSTRTPEGWTYAEVLQEEQKSMGWVPVFCLEWTD